MQNLPDIALLLKNRAAEVERALSDALLPFSDEAAIARLQEAMGYALTGGGKRMRPFLVLETAALFGAEDRAMEAAIALEMIHAYSLVHDDLPAMDDAETRRGKPSVHKQYDEAIAILTGDALLTESFFVLTSYEGALCRELCRELSRAAGTHGMVGGQMMDLYPEGETEEHIIALQDRKTGALIECAAAMGALVGGASDEETAALRTYAKKLGLAFQIADDLLDVTQTAEEIGKPAGRDEEMGKATFVGLLGEDGARARLRQVNDEARAALGQVERDTSVLEALLDWQAGRTS
ncbi:polyprenyl synthetase family protein [Parvularcula maris]|uniref:Polyprenyl synthetase family protein n=1 Tax=Parvularcula maris TaxID=2965077 RepID=A0A9X2RL31_9PROT|nr:farnesyl diphosphate synthase [Parvularcula maris]MCQ8186197.1 polyprenyl synthetase family protein [Parvularcula maris]